MSLSLHDSVANCSAAFGTSTEAGRVSPPEPNLATAGLSKASGKHSVWMHAKASSTASTWPREASPPSNAAKVSATLKLREPLNSQDKKRKCGSFNITRMDRSYQNPTLDCTLKEKRRKKIRKPVHLFFTYRSQR